MTLRFLIMLFLFGASVDAFSQSDHLNVLTKSFNSYQSNTVQEKIFVHTDRNFFVTGEVLWMKIYCLESGSNIPLDLSKVAYAEVMDFENKSQIQTKIELKNGSGNGSLFIPASLNSGNYTLRVYTNWMKNFSPEFYFHQEITIVNPFKKLEPIIATNQNSSKIEVKFYPEGGNLVTGLNSTVGFQITEATGKGINANGLILANGKDTVAQFSTLRFGIGSFSFTPQPKTTYEALLLSEKSKQRFALPIPLDTGYTLNVINSDNENVKITVQSTYQSGTRVYLIAHSENSIKAAKENVIITGRTQFVLPKDQLGKRAIRFTIFDNNLNPVCERLYFVKTKNNANLTVESNKTKYYTRQKISILIDSKDSTSLASLNASVAVRAIDSLLTKPAIDINTFTTLTSELRGNIEAAEFYLSNDDELTLNALDNLMLVHGWSKYSWNSILNPNGDSLASIHLPEMRGHLITGKIINRINNEPISGITTLLGTPSKIIRSYTSQSNIVGNIYFEMKDFYDAQRIFVQTLPDQGDSIKLEINDPFSSKLSSFKPTQFRLLRATEKELLEKSIAMQALSIFQPEYKGKSTKLKTDSVNFYGKADEDYELDDYTRFKSMEEVLREYVPGVIVRKKNEDFKLRVTNKPINRIFDKHPLILLDGVPIFDATKIMEYDPLKIKRLEVMTRLYYVGDLEAQGVISFTSYKGLAEGLEIDPQTISLDYEGLQRAREFYSPDYSTVASIQSRLADFRDLLYWNPNLTPDKNGKINIEFYSSDKTGKYEITVQGITKKGKPAVGYGTFTVTK